MLGGYLPILQHYPVLRLSWFVPLVKAVRDTGKSIKVEVPLPCRGIDYTLYVTPEVRRLADGLFALHLSWDKEGEKHEQQIIILREQSNLMAGSFIYYFLCPFGYRSRQLFYVNGCFRSRRSFGHLYESQTLSQRQRMLYPKEEPYRDNGKRYYRGKLTPYGKRCLRYEQREENRLTILRALIKGIP